MRFITIETKWNELIAITTNNITSIQSGDGTVYIYIGESSPIATKFTDIQHAVDYVQRASSVSLNNATLNKQA